jgi:MFS family permease
MPTSQSNIEKIFGGSNARGVIAAIASISIVGTGIGLSFPLLSLLMEQRGIAASIIGANTAVAGIAAMMVVPFVTPIARMLGVVNTMLATIGLSIFCLAGFYLSENLPLWFVLRFLFSASITTIFILSEFWINSASEEKHRGLILGIYGTVLSLGFAFGPGILAIVGTHGILPFLIGGGIIISAIVPISMGRNNEPELERAGKTPSVIPYLFIVPLATMAGFIFGAVEQIELALLPVFALRSGYEEQAAALLLTITGLGNVALQIPLGMWSDRAKDRRIVLLACTLAGLVGAVLIPLTVHIGWVFAIILFAYGGIISGMYTVGLAHLGSRLTGTDLAQANAAFVLCYGLGMTVGPQIAGIAMDVIGTSGFGVTLFAFFAIYLALYVFRVWKS